MIEPFLPFHLGSWKCQIVDLIVEGEHDKWFLAEGPEGKKIKARLREVAETWKRLLCRD